jgi:hypothetical protein
MAYTFSLGIDKGLPCAPVGARVRRQMRIAKATNHYHANSPPLAYFHLKISLVMKALFLEKMQACKFMLVFE